MERYSKFEYFMIDVIDEADKKCLKKHSKSLESLYEVSVSISEGLKIILKYGGWPGFVAIVALLTLGPIIFGVSLTSFAITPMGWVIIGALSFFGGAFFIKALYKNKALPFAIKETGNVFKPRYEEYLEESISERKCSIDNLLDSASDYLLMKAMESLGLR